jgi:hypothetical protein
MKGHSKTSYRLFINFQYQSINKYRLVLIDIDTHRFHRLSTPGCQRSAGKLSVDLCHNMNSFLHPNNKTIIEFGMNL